MDNDALFLPTPDGFPGFPYDPPYSIQSDLMRHVYESIERRQVTIVESPTGTVSVHKRGQWVTDVRHQGKTLSLLCSSLTWLVDENDRARKGQLSQQSTSSTGQ
jgi:chromosome transmission fidelity protein 1